MTTPTSHPARSHLTLLDRVDGRDDPVAEHPARRARIEALPDGLEPSGRPASRRRTGWFEANPGCFGRAVLATCGIGVGAGGVTAWAAWRAWRSVPVRRTRTVLRFGGRAWRRYRNVRRRLQR